MKMLWMIGLLIPNIVMGQVFNKRLVGNYKRVEVFAPIEINIINEYDFVQLYCKTKHLTSVILPLRTNETIATIGTGDDEKLWATEGLGTQVFTCKPSDLADKTTAKILTTEGRVFHFQLKNLTPSRDLFNWTTAEEEEAFEAYLKELATFDPYTVVILGFREDSLKKNEETILQQKRVALEQEIQEYKRLNMEIKAAQVEQTNLAQKESQARSRIYASLVDFDAYEVRYKNRKLKKKWPVHKVFNDGTFTWIQAPSEAPAFHVYELRDGKFELVNFELEDNLYRIDRVCSVLEFRDGPKGDWVFRVERDSVM